MNGDLYKFRCVWRKFGQVEDARSAKDLAMAAEQRERAARQRLEETDKERQRHLTDASRKCAFLETELARLDRVQERERERELELASLHDEMEVR